MLTPNSFSHTVSLTLTQSSRTSEVLWSTQTDLPSLTVSRMLSCRALALVLFSHSVWLIHSRKAVVLYSPPIPTVRPISSICCLLLCPLFLSQLTFLVTFRFYFLWNYLIETGHQLHLWWWLRVGGGSNGQMTGVETVWSKFIISLLSIVRVIDSYITRIRNNKIILELNWIYSTARDLLREKNYVESTDYSNNLWRT